MGAGLALLDDIEVLRMQRDRLDLSGDEAGQASGGALGDELRRAAMAVALALGGWDQSARRDRSSAEASAP